MSDYAIKENDSIFKKFFHLFYEGFAATYADGSSSFQRFDSLIPLANQFAKEIYTINQTSKKDVFIFKEIESNTSENFQQDKIHVSIESDIIKMHTSHYFYFHSEKECFVIDKNDSSFYFYVKNNKTGNIYFSGSKHPTKETDGDMYIVSNNLYYEIKNFLTYRKADIKHVHGGYQMLYQGGGNREDGVSISNVININQHDKIYYIEKKKYKEQDAYYFKLKNSQFSNITICEGNIVEIKLSKKTNTLLKQNLNKRDPIILHFNSNIVPSIEMFENLNVVLEKAKEFDFLKSDDTKIIIDSYEGILTTCIEALKTHHCKLNIGNDSVLKDIKHIYGLNKMRDIAIETTSVKNISFPLFVLEKNVVFTKLSLIKEVENIVEHIDSAFNYYHETSGVTHSKTFADGINFLPKIKSPSVEDWIENWSAKNSKEKLGPIYGSILKKV